jgi:uncharacterized protein YprB with RNaseH-like and TPR domain
MSSLQERLQRLRRPGPPLPPPGEDEAKAPPRSPLDRLEQELLGRRPGADDEFERVPLKERLERLVAVASLRGRRERRVEALPPLEELLDGMRIENERGEFFLVEEDIALESWHGDVSLARLRSVSSATVEVLTAEAGLSGFDLEGAVFLDTETTGLAGGAGTAAFLIGVGSVEGDRFRVRQYFMRDYHEEAALLRALAEDLQRFRRIVTFNGKMFDIPLLEARYRLNRDRFPLADAPHFDLLHPARRLWKARLESCRLQSLEAGLMGLRRGPDIPSELIPQVYFDWVRRRDARALRKVFRHNRDDIVSLAALAALACQWVEEERAEDPRDVLSLARVLERARLYERSKSEYRRAADRATGRVRTSALLGLAERAKKAGEIDEAAGLWAAAAEAGEPRAMHELAMHHEHRTRDLDAALGLVERALDLIEGRSDLRTGRMAAGFWRRRERLLSKLSRASARGARKAPAPGPRREG